MFIYCIYESTVAELITLYQAKLLFLTFHQIPYGRILQIKVVDHKICVLHHVQIFLYEPFLRIQIKSDLILHKMQDILDLKGKR